MLRRILLVLLYSCYGVMLVGVLLIVLFPRDSIRSWAAARVERGLPGYQCRIEEVRYVHPLRVGLYGLVLDNPAERISISMDSLLVGFEKQWPVRIFHLYTDVYGGSIKTSVSLNARQNSVDITNLLVSSVRLEDIDFIQKRLDRQIRGTYSMYGDASVRSANGLEVSFDGTVEIAKFFTKLRRPVLKFNDMDLAAITVQVQLEPGKVELSNGRYQGDLLSGEFGGTILLQDPLQQSRLDIAGGVIPDNRLLADDPEMTEAVAGLYREYRQEAIPCLVEGTIQEPQFRFGRK